MSIRNILFIHLFNMQRICLVRTSSQHVSDTLDGRIYVPFLLNLSLQMRIEISMKLSDVINCNGL